MLPCLLASPTVVTIGGTLFLARPITLGGFGSLLRNGADALGMDGDGGDLPAFGDPKFQAWLESAGSPLLIWECLKADEPGLTLARCVSLASVAGKAGIAVLIRVALRRARSAAPGEGKGKDVAELDWATTIYRRYEESGSLPAAVAGLCLDQVWLLASGGKGFEVADEGQAVLDDMQRQWEEKWGNKGEAPAPTLFDPGPVPEGVTPEVAAEVAKMGLRFAAEVPDVE